MVDTHTHLYLDDFDNDRDEAVNRAFDAGVRHLVLPNVDVSTIAQMYALNDSFPKLTSTAMGLHPTSVGKDYKADLEVIARELEARRHVAVGEIGIDMYWDKSFAAEQEDAFAAQIDLALQLDLPIIIHCREGIENVLNVFNRFNRLPAGVFHSFGGSAGDIRDIRKHGDFYFGINGIVTFKKSQVPALLPVIGIDRILLETDSPYLAPVPHRGKRNESAFIPHIAACVATHLDMDANEVSRRTDDNAVALFSLNL